GQILDPAADARVLLGSGGLHALHLVRILHGHAAPLDHHTPELEITLARLHETADARVAADVAGLDALSLRIKVDGAVQKGEPQRVGDRSAIPLERGQDQRALRRQELAHFLGRHGGGHPVPPGQHIKSRRARGTFGNARKTTTSPAIRDFPLLRPTNYRVDLLVVRGNLTIKGTMRARRAHTAPSIRAATSRSGPRGSWDPVRFSTQRFNHMTIRMFRLQVLGPSNLVMKNLLDTPSGSSSAARAARASPRTR